MLINYRDYLFPACENLNVSSIALTEPRNIGVPTDLVFKYKISYSKENLRSQANIFRLLIRGDVAYTNALNKYIDIRSQDRSQVLFNTYIYSYIKTIVAIRDIYDSEMRLIGALPANSLVFYGHKYLIHMFLDYNIFTPARTLIGNTYITRLLDLDNAIRQIEDLEVYKESYNSAFPGGIFNEDYERVLTALVGVKDIAVSYMSDKTDIPNDPFYCPLGNMAVCNKDKPALFSFAEESYATVNIRESLTDHKSKFWNIANWINIDKMPDRYNSLGFGTPYQFVPTKNVDESVIFAQVESITGLPNKGLYSTYGSTNLNTSGGSNPNQTNPLNPVGGSGKPGPKSPSGVNGSGSQPNGIGTPKGKNPNIPKKKGSRLVKFVKSTSQTIGRTLSSDEAKQLLKDASMSLYQSRLREQETNNLINNLKQIGIVKQQQKVKTNLGIVGSESSKQNLMIEDKNQVNT